MPWRCASVVYDNLLMLRVNTTRPWMISSIGLWCYHSRCLDFEYCSTPRGNWTTRGLPTCGLDNRGLDNLRSRRCRQKNEN